MVELKLTDPAKEAAWDEWYLAHLHNLLRVPGFRSAQRFRTIEPAESPLLAIYDVENGDVLTSQAYTSVGGRGSADQWKSVLTNWHRNLFEFDGRAPDVQSDEFLIVLDRKSGEPAAAPEGFTVLNAVGLDRTIVQRAYSVSRTANVPVDASRAFSAQRALVPMTSRLTA
jgi:hypothetical protein